VAIAPATQEPLQITAGDTVSFLKTLGDYPAGAGWGLTYEASGAVNYEFTSVASGNSHQLTVAAAITAGWLPGDYQLLGYAVNAGTAERRQIYQASLTIRANIPAGAAAPQTHAQKMIALIEAVQLGKAGHDILESDIEGSKIVRLSPQQLREERAYWVRIRDGEIDAERAAAGLPNRNKIKPRFQVKSFTVPVGYGPGYPR